MPDDSLSNQRSGNLVEGITLCAILSGLPVFAGATLLLKLFDSDLANHPILFVTLTSILFAVAVAFLGPRFPAVSKASYEPLFFDGSLSFGEKFARWLAQPKTSQTLLTTTLILSVLSVLVLATH
jgi:hypothetical protein